MRRVSIIKILLFDILLFNLCNYTFLLIFSIKKHANVEKVSGHHNIN